MKTQMKLFIFLSIIGGIFILGSCGEDEQSQQNIEKNKKNCDSLKTELDTYVNAIKELKLIVDSDSVHPLAINPCSMPRTVNTLTQGVSFKATWGAFTIYHFSIFQPPALNCTIPIPPLPDALKISKSGNNLIFEIAAAPTTDTLMVKVTDFGAGDQNRSLDVVINNFSFGHPPLSTPICKLIGSDNGRNINHTVAQGIPGGQMAVGNINASPIYIRNSTSNTFYEIIQAKNNGLLKTSHTSTEAQNERSDNQGLVPPNF